MNLRDRIRTGVKILENKKSIMKVNWDLRFMKLADYIAQWSKDHSTKVGAVIVIDKNPISMGYNGFPRGCDDDKKERHERPAKYDWVLHAEENAIMNAARHGAKTNGSTLYVNWFPCCKCAGMIINAGITRVVCDKEPDLNDERYGASWKIALEKLKEAKIEIVYMNYDANR
jgi:dCMP deaminase